MRILFIIGLLLVQVLTFAQTGEEELLEPEKAFAFSAQADGENNIFATWSIAEDYYMYRGKYRFELTADGVSLGEAVFPPGKIKEDEFFGQVETYVGDVVVSLPIERTASRAQTVKLIAHGQGCNEPVGVCYPPLSHEIDITLPPVAAGVVPAASSVSSEPDSSETGSAVNQLRSLIGDIGGEDEFLDVDDAFRLDVSVDGNGNSLLAHFDIADGYYLYRDKTRFETRDEKARVAPYDLPDGKSKYDEYFGDTEVYYRSFDVKLPLQRSAPEAGEMTLLAGYQGCAEDGICYPPVEKALPVALPQLVTSANAAEIEPVISAPAPQQQESDRSWLGYLLAAFGTGFLLTFTPCVLPLIPILSSVIVGQGESLTKAKGGMLAIAYVLGTAVTYAVIGAVAGATGDQLQAYFQNKWAIGIVSTVFVLMALSMFGLYEIQMPSAIQSRLQTKTQGMSGSLGAVFVLGLFSALIVGACVSPLLISALSVAIAKADPLLGAVIMFAMALGMGVVLIAIGFGAGFLVPKAGPWMDRVKYFFGILLIAVAIYLLGVLPEVPVLLLWSALFIVVAIYLGATQSLPEGANGWRYLGKGFGTVLLVWGVLAMLGGFAGNRDIFNPVPLAKIAADFADSTSVNSSDNESRLFIQVASLDELDTQLASAKAAGKPVILDYYADWCVDCLRMERGTFQDPQVRAALTNFTMLQVDVTDPNDPATRAIKQHYKVFGPPAMLFFDADGVEIAELRLYGYRDVEEFLAIIDRV